jgi:hypothetical protein
MAVKYVCVTLGLADDGVRPACDRAAAATVTAALELGTVILLRVLKSICWKRIGIDGNLLVVCASSVFVIVGSVIGNIGMAMKFVGSIKDACPLVSETIFVGTFR